MDLLGSILSSMHAPPSVGTSQKKIIKQQQQQLEKQNVEERDKLKKFREEIETKINEFIRDPEKQRFKFSVMNKVKRSIIHDVADIAGLTAFSFGEDEVDRYVMLFKKEFAPTDDELSAYRRGESWDPEKAKELGRQREEGMLEENKVVSQSSRKASRNIGSNHYKEKYEKLLGKDAGKSAAKVTTPNKLFGYVPSENKRDLRSIEQTLADLKAKKKQKLEQEVSE